MYSPSRVIAALAVACLLSVLGCSSRSPELPSIDVGSPPDNPFAAQQFFLAQRLSPDVPEYPLEHLFEVVDVLDVRRARTTNVTSGRRWVELGPGNIGGRTRAIAIDPADHDTLYAGGVAGGVWKSTDRGLSWRALDDRMLNLAVSTLVIDPSDPSVLYAGTGEGLIGGLEGTNFLRGFGVFRSTDAGASWQHLEATASRAFWYVNDLVVSPEDPHRLFAATWHGVYRSDDRGMSWELLLANPAYASAASRTIAPTQVGCTELAIHPEASPEILLAAFGSLYQDGLYRSDNGGTSWQRVLSRPNQGRMALAVSPSHPNTMYLTMAGSYGNDGSEWGKLVDVFRSNDTGESWQGRVDMAADPGPWLLSNILLSIDCLDGDSSEPYHQGWYDNVIAVDPLDPEVVWVGGIDLTRSDDGGRTWNATSYWYADQIYGDQQHPNYVHADIHAIVFDPAYDGVSNQTVYVGSDGGISRSQSARAAAPANFCPLTAGPLPDIVWENLNRGYAVTQFYHGDTSPVIDLAVGGTQDNGTNASGGWNQPNDWLNVYGGDGGYVAIHPSDPLTYYVEIQSFPTIEKTVDGGVKFTSATAGITDDDGLFITPFVMDPNDPETLWTGGRRPWRTRNGATSWQLAGSFFSSQISAIAVAPSDSTVVYLGFTAGQVASTRTALDTMPDWQVHAADLPDGWVSSLAVDPTDPDTAYCTYSTIGVHHLHRTQDGGASWQPLGVAQIPDLPAHWIAIRPCRPEQLFLATEAGVLMSDDAGETWSERASGLPRTMVESLDFRDRNTLVAFTHGRGAFRLDLEPCPRTPRRAGRAVRP